MWVFRGSSLSRWWQLKYFLFSPRNLGKIFTHFDKHIFQMGWNHQPEQKSIWILWISHLLSLKPLIFCTWTWDVVGIFGCLPFREKTALRYFSGARSLTFREGSIHQTWLMTKFRFPNPFSFKEIIWKPPKKHPARWRKVKENHCLVFLG